MPSSVFQRRPKGLSLTITTFSRMSHASFCLTQMSCFGGCSYLTGENKFLKLAKKINWKKIEQIENRKPRIGQPIAPGTAATNASEGQGMLKKQDGTALPELMSSTKVVLSFLQFEIKFSTYKMIKLVFKC